MGTQVEAVRTPFTAKQLYSALLAQWPGSVGSSPTSAGLIILVAQIALETGNFTSCWNWNCGNLMGRSGNYVQKTAYNGTTVYLRAYDSFEDGVSAYLGLLAAGYATALQSALSGDLTGFVNNLKTSSGLYYYGGESPANYLAALEPRYATYQAQLAGYGGGASPPTAPPTEVPAPPSSGWATALTVIAGGLALGGAAHVLLPPSKPARRRRRYA